MKLFQVVMAGLVLGSGMSARADSQTMLARLHGVGCNASTGVGQAKISYFVRKKLITAQMNIWNEYLCDVNSLNQTLTDIGYEAVFIGKSVYVTFNSDHVIIDLAVVVDRYADEVKKFEKLYSKKINQVNLVDYRILSMEWSIDKPELVEKLKKSARENN